jgi:hypothetical protein
LLGATCRPYPAELAAGSFRLGGLALLRLRTSAGMRSVLIDGGPQPVSDFRRLCRHLEGNKAGRSGRYREPAVTIRPKV